MRQRHSHAYSDIRILMGVIVLDKGSVQADMMRKIDSCRNNFYRVRGRGGQETKGEGPTTSHWCTCGQNTARRAKY